MKNFRFAAVLLLIYAILIFLIFKVESGSANSNIRSVFDAIWYSFVTLTTVGYGDFYPVTPVGKIIGLIFLLGSLGILGLLVGEITGRMSDFRESRKMGYQGTHFTHHVIIVGWDEFAHAVTVQLLNADRKVAIVTDKKEDLDIIYEEFGRERLFVLLADLKNVALFDKLNLMNASLIFINLKSDADKLISILNIKKVYPDRNFLVALESADLKDTFHTAGVTYVVSKNAIAAKLTASYIFEPDVANFASDLLSAAKAETEYDFQQFKVLKNNPYLNKTYGEAFNDLKTKHNIVLTGICKVSNNARELIKLPDDAVKIELGDYLIMILNGRTEKIAAEIFQINEGLA